MEKIILEEKGESAVLTINNPQGQNGVDGEMLDRMRGVLQPLGEREGLKVLIIRGAGEHFCRGREWSPAERERGRSISALEFRANVEKVIWVNEFLSSVPAVTVAAVRGVALGFGSGLAIQCDLTLAEETARFGFPEIKAGLPPTVVAAYLGRFVPRKTAFEMVVTGRELSAREALALGMITRVVPAGQLEEECERLAADLLRQPAWVLSTLKTFFREVEDQGMDQAYRYGVNLLATVRSSKGVQ